MGSEMPRKRETTGGPRAVGPAEAVAAAKSAPPTAAAGQHSMATSAGATHYPKMAEAAAQHSTETLHQRKKFTAPPARMALGGFVAAAAIGYFVLYTKKKPEASVTDVAKVAAGVSVPHPESTSPRR